MPTYTLADHAPILYAYENASIIGYNMMYEARFNEKWKYYNNGHGILHEAPIQYRARLDQIARKFSNTHDAGIIVLQETPKTTDDRMYFITQAKAANPDFEFISNRKQGDEQTNRVDLLTAYNTEIYEINHDLSKKLNDIALTEGLQGRTLSTVLFNKRTQKKILITNIHADFGKNILSDLEKIYLKALSLEIDDIAFSGDFNRNLLDTRKEYGTFSPSLVMDPSQPSKCIEDNSKHDIALHQNDYVLTLGKTKLNLNIAATKKTSFAYKHAFIPESRDGSITSPSMKPAETVTLLKDWYFADQSESNPYLDIANTYLERFLQLLMPSTESFIRDEGWIHILRQLGYTVAQTLHPKLMLPEPLLTYITEAKDHDNPRPDLSTTEQPNYMTPQRSMIKGQLFDLLYSSHEPKSMLTRSHSSPNLSS